MLRLLPLLVVTGCAGDPAPLTSDTADSAGDTAPAPSDAPAEWADPAYWEGEGPIDGLLLPGDLSGRRWEVRMATRNTSGGWDADPRVLATAFSSLSAFVAAGRLIVTGNVDNDAARARGVDAPIGAVYALSTADGESWTTSRWEVADATDTFVIDPALFRDGDGEVRATWYATSMSGGDPATFPGDHAVRTGGWRDGTFAEDGEAFAWPYLVDPVICVEGDTSWLLGTVASTDVLLARDDGDGYTLVGEAAWPDVSVPSCRVSDAGVVELAAQLPGGSGAPATAVLDEGVVVPGASLWEEAPWEDGCTSPSVVAWEGADRLLCAVYVDG